MNTVRCALASGLVAGWAALAAWCDAALGQGGPGTENAAIAAPEGSSTRTQWQERALRRGRPAEAGQPPVQVAQRTARPWSPSRRSEPLAVAEAPAPEEEAGPSAVQPEPIPTPTPLETKPSAKRVPGEIQFEPLPGEAESYGPGMATGGCDDCGEGCEGCDCCGMSCDELCGRQGCTCGLHRLPGIGLFRNMSLLAGVQGFKGPLDLGVNGNFGFHEGLNFGAPLGDPWCSGYQLGFEAVHSNFAGSQTDGGDRHGRDQIFLTGGVFRRAICGGLQGGVVFDYLHDSYYLKSDLRQIRSETSLVFDGCHEIGYWGAYGINKDRFRFRDQGIALFQPNDIFAGFYRRQFSGGGQGRFWGGATGDGAGIVGAELTVPLGSSWALENNFTCLIPKHGPAGGGQREEAWSISLQLVWYPGRPANRVLQNPYHPLFGVGDNSVFLIRR